MASRNAHPTAAGVEALLERLEAEGVKAGEAKAAAIVAEAEAKARAIRGKAEADASQMIEAARRDAANLERGGKEALKVAMREAVLDLKQALADRFRGEISRLVTRHTQDQDLLREMVLAVAGRAAETAGVDRADRVTVVLPADAIGLEDLRRYPTELRDGRLGQFVLGSAGELLRQGVTLTRLDDLTAGIEVRLKDHDIVLDLSDKAAAQAHFTRLTGLFKNLNYAPLGAPEYRSRLDAIEALDAAAPSGGSMVDEEA